ncbi:MAG TPA: hypothetical protein VD948_07920 [Rhodothermales bacterium]|nr:hypothetical protein [Rhodothermales bacterium]
MNRHTFLGMGAAAAQAAVSAVLLFALYGYAQRVLGIERFGVWSLVAGLAMVGNLAEMGLAGVVLRFTARHLAVDDTRAAARTVETGVLSALALTATLGLALYAPLAWGAGRLIPDPMLAAEARDLLPWSLALFSLNAGVASVLAGLDGAQRVHERSLLVLAGQVVLLTAGFALVHQFGLRGLVAAQGLQSLVTGVFAWVRLRRALGTLPPAPLRWSRASFREMIRFGVRWQLANLVMLLMDPLARAFAMGLGGPAFAGHFEFATRLAMQVRAVFVSAQQALVPLLTRLDAVASAQMQAVYVYTVRATVGLSCVVLPALCVAAGPAAYLWKPESAATVVALLLVLFPAWFFNLVSAPAYFDLVGQGRLNPVLGSHVAMAVANGVLGSTLGLAFGGLGVAVGYGLSVIAGSVFTLRAGHRQRALSIASLVERADVPLLLLATVGFGGAVAFSLTMGNDGRMVPVALAGTVGYVLVAAAVAARHPSVSALLRRRLTSTVPKEASPAVAAPPEPGVLP